VPLALSDLLASRRDMLVRVAAATAARAPHYAAVGETALRPRLDNLLDRLIDGVARRDLVPVAEYARGLARERFGSGYALSEVQVAINAVEEAVWRLLAAELPPDELGDALALAATVLGAAKDALAQEYVLLAARRSAPRVDVAALFGGTSS
jgi:hypothetical protein